MNSTPFVSTSLTRRILGIDPGLRVTGFGIVDASGDRLQHVTCGVIRSGEGSLPERLGRLHAGILELVQTYQPDLAVCEQVFVNVNPKSTLLLGQARGAALCALVGGGLTVHEYSASQIKQALVGYGRATKEQMQWMVQRMLDLPGPPSPDAADALAGAVCHVHADRIASRLGTRSARNGRNLR